MDRLMLFLHQSIQEFTILMIMNISKIKACFSIILKLLNFMEQPITYHLENRCGAVGIGTQIILMTGLFAELHL
jgi:hypothetical protein